MTMKFQRRVIVEVIFENKQEVDAILAAISEGCSGDMNDKEKNIASKFIEELEELYRK